MDCRTYASKQAYITTKISTAASALFDGLLCWSAGWLNRFANAADSALTWTQAAHQQVSDGSMVNAVCTRVARALTLTVAACVPHWGETLAPFCFMQQ